MCVGGVGGVLGVLSGEVSEDETGEERSWK